MSKHFDKTIGAKPPGKLCALRVRTVCIQSCALVCVVSAPLGSILPRAQPGQRSGATPPLQVALLGSDADQLPLNVHPTLAFNVCKIRLAISATSTTLTSYRSVTRPIHSPVPWLAYHLVPVTASHNLPVARECACGTLVGCALTSSGRTRLPLWTGFFPGADGLLSHQRANQEVSLLDRRSGERAVRRRCHPSHPLTSRL